MIRFTYNRGHRPGAGRRALALDLAGLDLNKLHTFFAVAEAGGVSAAARRLSVTPSAVSQGLGLLEAALGVRLFDRVGRRLILTREGELLQRRFRAIERELRETLEEVVNEEREVRGVIRVGLSLGVPRARFAAFAARFTRRHRRASLRVLYGSHAELNAMLLERRADAVLSFNPAGGSGARIEATRLFEQQLVLVGAKRWVAKGFGFDSLHETPIIDYYQSDPLIHRWIAHHHRRKPPALDVRAWAATTDLVLDLVLAGAGVGVVPHHLAKPYVGRRLGVVATGRPELVDSIWLKERAGAWRGPTLRAFRDAALDEFATLSA